MSTDRGPWMQTLTGQRFHLLDPIVEEVSLIDIAGQLAKLMRFASATSEPYSVAQHSVEVAMNVPKQWRAYALLHDAHEAYIGDRVTPMKLAMRALSGDGADPFAALEARIDQVIHQRFGLEWPLPPEAAKAVKYADMLMLATERRDLLPVKVDWGIDMPEPLPRRIRPEKWFLSEQMFLAEAIRLGLHEREG